jgi:hypothetical protein
MICWVTNSLPIKSKTLMVVLTGDEVIPENPDEDGFENAN